MAERMTTPATPAGETPEQWFTHGHNSLNRLDMLLVEAGFKQNSSMREFLRIAKSQFNECERRLRSAQQPVEDAGKPVPEWVTSWPDWFGIEFPNSVTVVPKEDYERLAREKRELFELNAINESGCEQALQRYEAAAGIIKALTEKLEAAESALRARSEDSEPTEAMLVAARNWSYMEFGKPIGDTAARGCWKAMLAARKGQQP